MKIEVIENIMFGPPKSSSSKRRSRDGNGMDAENFDQTGRISNKFVFWSNFV